MEQSGFVTRLRNLQQPCTILAPSDEAFQKIPQSRLERILNDKEAREGTCHLSGVNIINFLSVASVLLIRRLNSVHRSL